MNEYEKAREKYNPNRIGKPIRFLFIAESPPHVKMGLKRFFYFPMLTKDGLFKSIMQVLYPGDLGRDKKDLLKMFQEDGFFLMDACSEPINHLEKKSVKRKKILDNYKKLIKKLKSLDMAGDAKIVLVTKGTVHHILYKPLKRSGFNVVAGGFPFPRYRRERDEFKVLLKKLTRKFRKEKEISGYKQDEIIIVDQMKKLEAFEKEIKEILKDLQKGTGLCDWNISLDPKTDKVVAKARDMRVKTDRLAKGIIKRWQKKIVIESVLEEIKKANQELYDEFLGQLPVKKQMRLIEAWIKSTKESRSAFFDYFMSLKIKNRKRIPEFMKAVDKAIYRQLCRQ